MDQINQAFQRIQLVLGVSGGIISHRQIRDIALLNHLDEHQLSILNTMLAEHGIRPMEEDEFDQLMDAQRPAPKAPVKEEPTAEERAMRLEQVLLTCRKVLEEHPTLAVQYQEELPLLKKAIAEKAEDSRLRKSDRLITRAILSISQYRVRDIRQKGWVCGTHSNRVAERFRDILNTLLTAEEQSKLIAYCANPDQEQNDHFEEILLFLLHRVPKIIVHSHVSEYLNT